MIVINWSENVEGSGDNIDSPLCGGLYKEEDDSLVSWSGTDPDAKTNCFTWYKYNNDWIVPGDQYDEEFNNWRGPTHNSQFNSQTLEEKRKREKICSKYAGSTKFNVIPMKVKSVIPIKSYKYQCHDHIIMNGIWDVFSLTYQRNKENSWDILLHQSRFPLEYVKRHVQSLQKVSEADQYVVQNLTWSGVYLRSTLSNILLQKVLTLVPFTATGPDVFVVTMTTLLSDSYDAFEETLTHMKSLKLKICPGDNVTDFCASILVDAQRLDSSRDYKPDHLGYTTRMFEDTSDSRFRLWAIQHYKEDTELIKKLCVCDIDVISQEDLITYESLVQEVYARIMRSCGFKAVGTGYQKRKVSRPTFTSEGIQCGH